MKALLVWPNSRNEVLGWGDLGAIAEPLALEYLAAGLKLDSHEVRGLDLRLHRDELDITLRGFVPDLVAVTAFSMHVRTALVICRRAKELLPKCWTVAGGHHASFLPEDFFEEQVDFVVSGEGAVPLRALARALESNAPVSNIPGLWSRVGERFVSGGEQRAFHLNDLVPPDRSAMLNDRGSYFIDWMKPVALLRTSVGTGAPSVRSGRSLVDLRRGGALAPFPEVPVQTVRADFPHTAYRWSSQTACAPPG